MLESLRFNRSPWRARIASVNPLLSYLWYELVYLIGSVGLTVTHSLRIEGASHMPKQGPVLVIANHQSFLDPWLAGIAVRRHLVYLARKTLFRKPLFAALIRSLNAVAIDQEGIGKEGIKAILQQLALGKPVLIFPEGERTGDGRLHALRPGVHLLIKRAAAPIVPVGIAGAFDAWPRTRQLPGTAPLFLPARAGTIAVSVGRPLTSAQFAALPREQAMEALFRELHQVWERADRLRRTDYR